jgi:hypothetical protein
MIDKKYFSLKRLLAQKWSTLLMYLAVFIGCLVYAVIALYSETDAGQVFSLRIIIAVCAAGIIGMAYLCKVKKDNR